MDILLVEKTSFIVGGVAGSVAPSGPPVTVIPPAPVPVDTVSIFGSAQVFNSKITVITLSVVDSPLLADLLVSLVLTSVNGDAGQSFTDNFDIVIPAGQVLVSYKFRNYARFADTMPLFSSVSVQITTVSPNPCGGTAVTFSGLVPQI